MLHAILTHCYQAGSRTDSKTWSLSPADDLQMQLSGLPENKVQPYKVQLRAADINMGLVPGDTALCGRVSPPENDSWVEKQEEQNAVKN